MYAKMLGKVIIFMWLGFLPCPIPFKQKAWRIDYDFGIVKVIYKSELWFKNPYIHCSNI